VRPLPPDCRLGIGIRKEPRAAATFCGSPCHLRSYGYACLEACDAEKPVITCTDSGGPLELIENGRTGLAVEPDPRALAEAMDRLFEDRAEAAAMGRSARERINALGAGIESDRSGHTQLPLPAPRFITACTLTNTAGDAIQPARQGLAPTDSAGPADGGHSLKRSRSMSQPVRPSPLRGAVDPTKDPELEIQGPCDPEVAAEGAGGRPNRNCLQPSRLRGSSVSVM
jgi:hypothetical protein